MKTSNVLLILSLLILGSLCSHLKSRTSRQFAHIFSKEALDVAHDHQKIEDLANKLYSENSHDGKELGAEELVNVFESLKKDFQFRPINSRLAKELIAPFDLSGNGTLDEAELAGLLTQFFAHFDYLYNMVVVQ